jgi:hypothetical protein
MKWCPFSSKTPLIIVWNGAYLIMKTVLFICIMMSF